MRKNESLLILVTLMTMKTLNDFDDFDNLDDYEDFDAIDDLMASLKNNIQNMSESIDLKYFPNITFG